MFTKLQIRPKIGDLVRVLDPCFDGVAFGYCIESNNIYFTLRYFDDETKQYDFEYWYDEAYDLEMKIIT